MMKDDRHTFKGMGRSGHQIRQDSSLLWDAYNIAFEEQDNDTRLSITNLKKDVKKLTLSGFGVCIGHCVVGDYLILFFRGPHVSTIVGDKIIRIDKNLNTKTLYNSGKNVFFGNAEWIEAIGIVESELIQKVYWVDGKHQPRVINITKPELINYDVEDSEDLTDCYTSEIFDFCQTIDLKDTISVEKYYSNGIFSPGIIQYLFTYYYKYGQETCIFNSTPIHYISNKNLGVAPDNTVANSFKITLKSVDEKFDGIKVYSLHRTSLEGKPELKFLGDIKIEKGKSSYEFIDTGNIGETIDESLLLYIGGTSFIANCIATKDNTLFLGGIKLNDNQESLKKAIDTYKKSDNSCFNPKNFESITKTPISGRLDNNSYYYYSRDLDHGYNAHFKTHEFYKVGIQFQHNTGRWSDPILLGVTELSNSYPKGNDLYQYTTKQIKISNSEKSTIIDLGYKRVRTCIVIPKLNERRILCQGVLCPTVFNGCQRALGNEYAISSWFFRPMMYISTKDSNLLEKHGTTIANELYYPLVEPASKAGEIQNMLSKGRVGAHEYTYEEITGTYRSTFFVDSNIVTMHSPDIEFTQDLINTKKAKLHLVGYALLDRMYGAYNISAGTPLSDIGKSINVTDGLVEVFASGCNHALAAEVGFKDVAIKTDYTRSIYNFDYIVYPWQRSGSMNNDTKRPDDKGTQSAELKTKQLFNLKTFKTKWLDDTENSKNNKGDVNVYYYSKNDKFIKIANPFTNTDVTYSGEVDFLNTSSEFPIYVNKSTVITDINGQSESDLISKGTEPVRIKYKSTNHLVISLGIISNSIQSTWTTNFIKGQINVPLWLQGNYKDTGLNYVVKKISTKKETTDLNPGEALFYINNSNISVLIYNDNTLNRLTTGDYRVYIPDNLTIESSDFNTIKPVLDKFNISIGYVSNRVELLYNYKFTFHYSVTENEITDGHIENGSVQIVEYSTDNNYIVQMYKNATNGFCEGADTDEGNYPALHLVELRTDITKDDISTENPQQFLWLPSSDPVSLDNGERDASVPFVYGDTRYARYDCLKTYPFTNEDENSIIEVGSFLCETRVNIDAFTDRNRGKYPLFSVSDETYNIQNPVYEQTDDFIPNRIASEYLNNIDNFPTQITWSEVKLLNSETDNWTKITLLNTLDLPGNLGNLVSIRNYKDTLFAFQEKGISQILFNERVQIPTNDDVPIEISNGLKVQGYRNIIDNIGVQNKWSICQSNNSIYFLDKYNKGIFRLKDLNNIEKLSYTHGVQWYINSVINNEENRYYLGYNNITNELIFSQPNADYGGLIYSENLDSFVTRFGSKEQDSEGSDRTIIFNRFFNFNDKFYAINMGSYNCLYEPFSDDSKYSGRHIDWMIEFISNKDPEIVKTFDVIELHADRMNDIDQIGKRTSHNAYDLKPFWEIRVSNEYQEAHTDVFNDKLREKFRTWRMHIPRCNRDRIVNTWASIQLSRNSAPVIGYKNIIHDINVKYSV